MKLREALFRETWKAYQVLDEPVDWDNFSDWNLLPLLGPTVAAENVDGVFQGLFIIAAQIISSDAAPQPCYLDLVLPERIVENHFFQVDGRVAIQRGRRTNNGTVIPAVGIESFGVYKLFYARENPSAGIDVLKRGMQEARHREYLAEDLAYLLRDEKRYQEAIEAFTVVLMEHAAPEISHAVYKERSRLYAAIGQLDKAEEDERLATLALKK